MFFFLTIPHLPTSTLFPYTTLFRSHCQLPEDGPEDPTSGPPQAEQDPDLGSPGVVPRDRKSTRLNSSHQIISYAVFCLKKKKLSLILAKRHNQRVKPLRILPKTRAL